MNFSNFYLVKFAFLDFSSYFKESSQQERSEMMLSSKDEDDGVCL